MKEILHNIGFDWQVALANLVNFLIILFILKQFAWKPIRKIIGERQKKIEKGLEDAKKSETALMMTEERRKDIENKARLEANNIVLAAQVKAKEIVTEAKIVAEHEKENIINQGKLVIKEERNLLEEEMKKKIRELVADGVKKVLSQYVTKEVNNELVSKMLAKHD